MKTRSSIMTPGAAAIVLAALTRTGVASADYPKLDIGTHWQIAAQTFTSGNVVRLSGIAKTVAVKAARTENRLCFSEISVPGVIIDGTEYGFQRLIEQSQDELADSLDAHGTYEVVVAGKSVQVALSFRFFKDGKFLFGAAMPNETARDVQVPIRINYDFKGPRHDLAEFVWTRQSSVANGGAIEPSPPIGVPELDFVVSTISAPENVEFWTAVPHEVALNYSGLYQDSNPLSVEYSAMVRVRDPYNGIGAVFWPWSDTGEATTDYTVVLTRAAASGGFVPKVDTAKVTQAIDRQVASYPAYAHEDNQTIDGRDQMMHVVMKGTLGGTQHLQLAGKLFQKPINQDGSSAGRRVRLGLHTWGAMTPWVPNGTSTPSPITFTGDTVARFSDGSMVSLKQAFQALVGGADVTVDVVAETGESTIAQAVALQNRDGSTAAREDVDNWRSDLYVLLDGPGNSMFDGFNGGSNKIEREAAHVSWNTIRSLAQTNFNRCGTTCPQAWSPDWQLRFLVFAAVHELGHTFNLEHEAETSVFMYTPPDYVVHQPFGLFGAFASNIVRNFPESWTKPGRFGVPMSGDYSVGGAVLDRTYQALSVIPQAGDANFNGIVDIVDALMIAQVSVGLDVGQEFYPEVADVNCDGAITIVDALMVAQFGVGSLTSLGCT